jgi:hypothetical protein
MRRLSLPLVIALSVGGNTNTAEFDYPLPCTLNITVILASPQYVNDVCHDFDNIQNDWGEPVKPGEWINGCINYEDNVIIVSGDAKTLKHEFDHLWKHYCTPN